MKLRELIELLQQEDGERLVVLAIDTEGNGFKPLSEISTAAFEDGDIGLEELTEDLRAQGYSEEDLCYGEPAIVLWPVG